LRVDAATKLFGISRSKFYELITDRRVGRSLFVAVITGSPPLPGLSLRSPSAR